MKNQGLEGVSANMATSHFLLRRQHYSANDLSATVVSPLPTGQPGCSDHSINHTAIPIPKKRPSSNPLLKPIAQKPSSALMKIPDLTFCGFNRRVAALHRSTGRLIWQWRAPKGSRYVSLLLDGDLLIVAVDGYMYGLNAISGETLWFNEMEGFGTGVTALVSANGIASNPVNIAAAQIAANQSASSSSNVASAD